MSLIFDLQQNKQAQTRITRNRISVSCTECKRRKQKCNRETPCNECSKRFYPVPCVYETFRKPDKSKKSVVDLNTTVQSENASSTIPGRAGSSSQADDQAPYNLASRSSTSPLNGLALLQVSSRHPSRGSLSSSPGSSRSPDLLAIALCGNGSDPDVSTAFSMGIFYPYPDTQPNPQYSQQEVPEGGVDLEPLSYLPIEPSRRHTELFRFFTLRLSGYTSSIDGKDPPESFMNQYIPFMIQSPIAIYVTILTSCYFQASTRGIPFDKDVEIIGTKVKLITLINEHIANNSKVSDDAIAAVMSLTQNELIYADEKSTLAHIRGLRDMIKTRGGFLNIEFRMLRMMLLRTDFQVACTYECDLFMHDNEPIPTLYTYPLMLESPILLSPHSITTSASLLGINLISAQILDDVRFLTTSVIQLSTMRYSEDIHTRFAETIQWVYARLTSSDPMLSDDYVYQSIHTAALIYTSAILTRRPLSQTCTQELLSKLWASLWRVPLTKWKQIPGIFFWILLVVNPYTRDKAEGRFVKGLMPATTVAIGMLDSEVLVGITRAFLGVQRWLRGAGGGVGAVVGPVRAVSGVPAGGLPEWSITE